MTLLTIDPRFDTIYPVCPSPQQAPDASAVQITDAVLQALKRHSTDPIEFPALRKLHAQVLSRSGLLLTEAQKDHLFLISLEIGFKGISRLFLEQVILLIPKQDRCQETLLDLISLLRDNNLYEIELVYGGPERVVGTLDDANYEILAVLYAVPAHNRAAFISRLANSSKSLPENLANIHVFLNDNNSPEEERIALLEAFIKLPSDACWDILSSTVAITQNFSFLPSFLFRIEVLQALQEVPLNRHQGIIAALDPFINAIKAPTVEFPADRYVIAIIKSATVDPAIHSVLCDTEVPVPHRVACILSLQVLMKGITEVSQQLAILKTISDLPDMDALMIVMAAGEILEISRPTSLEETIALLQVLNELASSLDDSDDIITCAMPLFTDNSGTEIVKLLRSLTELPAEKRESAVKKLLDKLDIEEVEGEIILPAGTASK